MRRIRTLALLGAVALFAAACATKAPPAAGACYWLKEDGSRWIERPDVATKAICFELDSCNGGKGMSGGGCYKWSKSADAPGETW